MSPKQARDLILWLRKERIFYTRLVAGELELDGVIDGKLASAPPPKPEPRKTMFQQYGEEILTQPVTTVDDVPDEAKVD